MNDSSQDPAPRGLAALRHLLVDDEGGSAAVEFIVLIPVYIMMLGAMFSLALVMLTRQQVVAATRYEAWSFGRSAYDKDEATISRSFIGRTGTWSRTPPNEQAVELTVSGTGAEIANKVLENSVQTGNDSGEKPLRLVKVTGSFEWGGLKLLTGRDMTISTDAAVILMNDHKRPIFVDKQPDEHAMADTQTGFRSGADFDPAGDLSNPFTNPVFASFTDTTAPDMGIWKKDVRIQGSIDRERSFYGGQNPSTPR